MSKPLSQCEPGASGYIVRSENEILDSLASKDVPLVEGKDFFKSMQMQYALPPHSNDLSAWVARNQGRVGRCVGSSQSQTYDMEHYQDTGEEHLSSMSAHYYLAQEVAGMLGSDGGVHPDAGVEVATKIGFVPQSVYGPQPDTYAEIHQRGVSEEMRAAAEPFKIQSVVRLASFDEVKQAILTQGGHVQTSSLWLAPMDAQPDRIDAFKGPQENAQHGGGHAWQTIGITPDGEPIVGNTWGAGDKNNPASGGWGDAGGKSMSVEAYSELLADPMSICLLFTRTTTPVQRKIELVSSDWT